MPKRYIVRTSYGEKGFMNHVVSPRGRIIASFAKIDHADAKARKLNKLHRELWGKK